MRDNGFRCFWSGCLTLLLRPQSEHKTADVVVSDVAERKLQQIPAEIRRRGQLVTHHVEETEPEKRLTAAREVLALYARARLVVSSRLHAMLPCAAYGTPVVLIKPKSSDADRRFSGYEHLAWPPQQASWHKPLPRLTASLVHASAAPARLAIATFVGQFRQWPCVALRQLGNFFR